MHYGNSSILLTCTVILLTNSIFAGPFPTYPVQWHTNLFQGCTRIHTHIPLSQPSLQMFSLTLNFIIKTRSKWTAELEQCHSCIHLHAFPLVLCIFPVQADILFAVWPSVCLWQLNDWWEHFFSVKITSFFRHTSFLPKTPMPLIK